MPLDSRPRAARAPASRLSRLLLFALVLLALVAVPKVDAAGEACSASQKCPNSSPCCGAAGTCGSGALQCNSGCQPLSSYKPTSCTANAICATQNITFAPDDYKNDTVFRPSLRYTGDPSLAPFTLDFGSLSAGPVGVLLRLTKESQTKISTTRSMLYGSFAFRARYAPQAGVVLAGITMSNVKDEIDWEMTGGSGTPRTNFFHLGVTAQGTASDLSAFDVSQWHTYGVNWQPDSLQWLVDGQVRRTVNKKDFSNSWPSTPSQVQLSLWSGGNATNAAGTIEWAGGATDWSSSTYTQNNGSYLAEIHSVSMTCADQGVAQLQTVGNGTAVTSWVYTGANSTSTNGPEVALSRDPITFLDTPLADGHPGLPGYGTESAASSNSQGTVWDGSGSTSSSVAGSTSSGGTWFTKTRVIIVAASVAGALALLFLWAFVVRACRRRRRNEVLAAGAPTGIKGGPGQTPGGGAGGVGMQLSNVAASGGAAAAALGMASREPARYKRVDDDEDAFDEDSMASPAKRYYDLPATGAVAPEGAMRQGRGYGPAPGPSPSASAGAGAMRFAHHAADSYDDDASLTASSQHGTTAGGMAHHPAALVPQRSANASPAPSAAAAARAFGGGAAMMSHHAHIQQTPFASQANVYAHGGAGGGMPYRWAPSPAPTCAAQQQQPPQQYLSQAPHQQAFYAPASQHQPHSAAYQPYPPSTPAAYYAQHQQPGYGYPYAAR